MGLVSELQIIASNPESSPLDVLRKALVVSNKLGQKNDWISKELNGYQPEEIVPDYRCVIALVMYNSMSNFHHLSGATFELAPQTNIDLRDSIIEIESICDSDESFVKLAPSIEQIDMLQNYAKRQDPNCVYEFYHSVHMAQFKRILESCKTKVLEWALELESAGIVGENYTFKEDEKQAANGTSIIVNNTIQNQNKNAQRSSNKKKRTIITILVLILIGGIGSVWWNWTATYTQEYVKPLFDTMKSFTGAMVNLTQ